MRLRRSKFKIVSIGLLSSLICALSTCLQVKSAERLEVKFEGMSIPIPISELADWAQKKRYETKELKVWLNLIDKKSRKGVIKLLKAPLLKDRSMARQLLRSWSGQKLLDELSDFIRLDDDRSGKKVFSTFEELLNNQTQVSTLDLIQALPASTISIDFDGLLSLFTKFYLQIQFFLHP